MSAITSTPIDVEAKGAITSGRLFFLDLSGGRILSANPDGSDLKTTLNEGRKLPDGRCVIQGNSCSADVKSGMPAGATGLEPAAPS
ncbi:MAG: hypothetical protein WB524_03385 [Acidobacteriaceae bacterium]|jgi:hypothetical protein